MRSLTARTFLMQKRDLQNAAYNVVGESLWGFQAAMVSSATVLVVVLRQFGAGRAMIGSITSIETFAWLFPQIIGLYLFRSRSRRKSELIIYHYVAAIPILVAIGWVLRLSPALPVNVTRVVVLTFWGLYVLSIGIVLAVWMDWVAGVFDVRFRGTAMGLAFFGSSAMGLTGGLLSGRIIGQGHALNAFSTIYVAAACIAAAAMSPFWLMEDPARFQNDPPPPSMTSILRYFRLSLSDTDFRAFLIGRILATSGFCIVPLIGDYFSSPEGGAIGPGKLVCYGASTAVGAAIANLGLGRIGDKAGHRVGLIIGAGTQILALLVLLLVPGELGCLPVYVAAGVCVGSAAVSHYNMVFETCPHDNRTAHIILANLVIGASTVFTPIVAGMSAAHWGMPFVFAGSLALSIAALLWFLLRVREPRLVGQHF